MNDEYKQEGISLRPTASDKNIKGNLMDTRHPAHRATPIPTPEGLRLRWQQRYQNLSNLAEQEHASPGVRGRSSVYTGVGQLDEAPWSALMLAMVAHEIEIRIEWAQTDLKEAYRHTRGGKHRLQQREASFRFALIRARLAGLRKALRELHDVHKSSRDS